MCSQRSGIAQTISLLLHDALKLSTPKRVSIINANDSTNITASSLLHNHAYNLILLSLSDALSLFDALSNTPTLISSPTYGSTSMKPKLTDARSTRASHKLRFYAAWIVKTVRGADDWVVKRVVREAKEKMRVLEREGLEKADETDGEVKTRE